MAEDRSERQEERGPGRADEGLEAFELSGLQALLVRSLALGIGAVGRVADLLLLVWRPRLLGAYLGMWAAELRRSPYRWPRSFETIRTVKASGQTLRELMYGEVLLASAVWLFWKAGVGPGTRLLDLGAGRGRALLAARWLGAEARGVELLDEHVRLVCGPLARAGAVLERGDAAQASLEGVTHLFLNWCAFGPDTKARLVEQLRRASPGLRVVAVTQPVQSPSFRVLSSTPALFTWGFERAWLQEHRAPPAPAAPAAPPRDP